MEPNSEAVMSEAVMVQTYSRGRALVPLAGPEGVQDAINPERLSLLGTGAGAKEERLMGFLKKAVKSLRASGQYEPMLQVLVQAMELGVESVGVKKIDGVMETEVEKILAMTFQAVKDGLNVETGRSAPVEPSEDEAAAEGVTKMAAAAALKEGVEKGISHILKHASLVSQVPRANVPAFAARLALDDLSVVPDAEKARLESGEAGEALQKQVAALQQAEAAKTEAEAAEAEATKQVIALQQSVLNLQKEISGLQQEVARKTDLTETLQKQLEAVKKRGNADSSDSPPKRLKSAAAAAAAAADPLLKMPVTVRMPKSAGPDGVPVEEEAGLSAMEEEAANAAVPPVEAAGPSAMEVEAANAATPTTPTKQVQLVMPGSQSSMSAASPMAGDFGDVNTFLEAAEGAPAGAAAEGAPAGAAAEAAEGAPAGAAAEAAEAAEGAPAGAVKDYIELAAEGVAVKEIANMPFISFWAVKDFESPLKGLADTLDQVLTKLRITVNEETTAAFAMAQAVNAFYPKSGREEDPDEIYLAYIEPNLSQLNDEDTFTLAEFGEKMVRLAKVVAPDAQDGPKKAVADLLAKIESKWKAEKVTMAEVKEKFKLLTKPAKSLVVVVLANAIFTAFAVGELKRRESAAGEA